MIASPHALPTLPPDAHARPEAPARTHPDPLSALLSSSLPISEVAASLNLSLPDLLSLCQFSDFQSNLAAIDDLTQTRLRIHSAQARLTAIQALESLTRSTQDPVERRRAALGLMRATTAATRRTHAHADDIDDESDHSHARPRPRHLPSRRLRPDQVAALIARALADNDAPAPDSGLATLHAFLSPDTKAASPHLPDFIAAAHDQVDDQAEDQVDDGAHTAADLPLPDLEALADLLDTPSAEQPVCSAPTQHGRTAAVELHWPSSTRAQSPVPSASPVRLSLTRPDTGPHRMCWLIDRIARLEQTTGPPSE